MRRLQFSGEVDQPADEPQTLTTKVRLFNLIRTFEKVDEAKEAGDETLSTVAGIVDTALTQYFDSLPEAEQRRINGAAERIIQFEIDAETRRTAHRAEMDALRAAADQTRLIN